jgi:hypothetical protein
MQASHEVAPPRIEQSGSYFEPPIPTSFELASRRANLEHAGTAAAALAGTPLASRFCYWEGFSGRRYVFSVYEASDCPAFCNAVLLPVVRDGARRRRTASIFDTGAFPESVVARVEREFSAFGPNLEFHLHLLARSPAEREAALVDLAIDTGAGLG